MRSGRSNAYRRQNKGSRAGRELQFDGPGLVTCVSFFRRPVDGTHQVSVIFVDRRVLPPPTPTCAHNKPPCSAAMSRSRVPAQQLLANLQSYHSYLLQDPCANTRARAYVEAQISFLASTSSLRSAYTDCGEPGGLETRASCSGPRALSASSAKATATT